MLYHDQILTITPWYEFTLIGIRGVMWMTRGVSVVDVYQATHRSRICFSGNIYFFIILHCQHMRVILKTEFSGAKQMMKFLWTKNFHCDIRKNSTPLWATFSHLLQCLRTLGKKPTYICYFN